MKCKLNQHQHVIYGTLLRLIIDYKMWENACGVCRIEAFLKSDHNRCASKFLAAYSDGDVDEIKKIAQSSAVSHLDHAVSNLAYM